MHGRTRPERAGNSHQEELGVASSEHGQIRWLRVAFLAAWLLLVLTYGSRIAAAGNIVLHLTLLAGLLLHLVDWFENRGAGASKPLFAVWLALFAVLVIAIGFSPEPRLGIDYLLRVVLPAMVVYQVVTGTLFDAEEVVWGFVLGASGLALLTIGFVMSTVFDWFVLSQVVRGEGWLFPPTFPEIEGLAEGPNVIGAVLAMTLPFAVFLRTAQTQRPRRWIAGGAAITIGLALLATVSRGAWLGAAAGLAAAVLVRSSGRWPRRTVGKSRKRRVLSYLGLALGFGALALVAVVGPPWLVRNTLGFRGLSIGASLSMMADRPWSGFGPGTFPNLVGQYVDAPPSLGTRLSLWHSHNIAAQIGSDSGVIGLVGAAFAMLLIGWFIVRLWRKRTARNTPWLTGVIAAIVALATHGLVDVQIFWVGPVVALAVVVGIAVKLSSDRIAPRQPARSVARLLTVLLLLFGFAAWVVTDRGHLQYEEGLAAVRRGNINQAVAALERATEIDPTTSVYWRQLGTVVLLGAESESTESYLSAAENHFSRAVALAPNDPVAWVNLGYVRTARGDEEGALAALAQSVETGTLDEGVLNTAGRLYETLGSDLQAPGVYAGALSLDPSLALDDYWLETDLRRDALQTALKSFARSNPGTSCYLAASASLGPSDSLVRMEPVVDACRNTVDSGVATADQQLYWSVYLFGTGSEEAGVVFRNAAVDAGNPRQRLALGMKNWHEGNAAAARSEWLAGMLMGDTISASLLIGSYQPDGLPSELRQEAAYRLPSLGSLTPTQEGRFSRFASNRTISAYWRQPYPVLFPESDSLPVSAPAARVFESLKAAQESGN